VPHYSEEEIRNYLLAVETPPPERADWHTWTTWNLRRFRRTLELVPPAESGDRCLEIGSIPYTFALLMKRFHQYSLAHVDFFAGGERQFRKIIRLPALGKRMNLRASCTTWNVRTCHFETKASPECFAAKCWNT
jgi:hypothetical protein